MFANDPFYLYSIHSTQVRGCIDLRYLVLQCHNSPTNRSEKLPKGMGLNALSQRYLERTLDKDWRVRASDWEANDLTQRQVLIETFDFDIFTNVSNDVLNHSDYIKNFFFFDQAL